MSSENGQGPPREDGIDRVRAAFSKAEEVALAPGMGNVKNLAEERHKRRTRAHELFERFVPAVDIEPNLDPEYLVKGWLIPKSLSVVYGQPNVGKSFFALDLAHAIARGRPWGSCRVRKSLVVYVTMEGGAGFDMRVKALGDPCFTGLHLIDPGTVTVERLRSGRLRYTVTGAPSKVLLQDEVLHIRYRLARDGVMGQSPIQIGRETFNLALSQNDAASKQAAKGFRPEGAVVFAQSINPNQKADVLDKLRQKIERNDTTSGVLVLDGGADWKPFAFSSKDAEFLESRKLTALDICRIYGVPPSAAGITDNATYSNIGEESRALVQRCLAPMARRIEQTMNAALLTVEGRKLFFIEHDLAGLLRGDMAARYTAYRIGRDGGWLSANEIRRLENLPEIEGGDDYLTPLNMATTGKQEGV